jgi:hypothetical protein
LESKNNSLRGPLSDFAILNPPTRRLSTEDKFVVMDAVTPESRYPIYLENKGSRSGSRAAAGDVLFARITPCLQNGKVAQVPSDVDACGGSTEFIVLRAKESVLPSYLYYVVSSPGFREKAQSVMEGSTGRQRASARDIARIEVAVPKQTEQRRIVAVLEQADRAVEAAVRHVADAQTLLKASIEASVDPSNVPTGWVDTALGSFLTRSKEKTNLNAPDRYQQITVRLRGGGVIERNVVLGAQIAGDQRFTARTGHFILSKIDARNGAFGIVPEELDGAVVSNDFPLMNVDEQTCLGAYLALIAKTDWFVASCAQASMGTTNRQRLSEADLLATQTSMPPLAEQQAIVARIEKVETAVRAAEAHLERLRALRSSLLENLVSGRVRLPEIETAGSKAAA